MFERGGPTRGGYPPCGAEWGGPDPPGPPPGGNPDYYKTKYEISDEDAP